MPHAEDNSVYALYKVLSSDSISGKKDWEAEKQEKRARIIERVRSCTADEIMNLWTMLHSADPKLLSKKEYFLGEGLDALWESLKETPTVFLQCLSAYIAAGSVCWRYSTAPCQHLISLTGFSGAVDFIQQLRTGAKRKWMATLFCLIPEECISEETETEILGLLDDQKEAPQIVSANTIVRINAKFSGYIVRYLSKLAGVQPSYYSCVAAWMEELTIRSGLSGQEILSLFDEKIGTLEETYLISVFHGNGFADYQGELLFQIVKADLAFLEVYITDTICKNKINDGINRLKLLWKNEEDISLKTEVFLILREASKKDYYRACEFGEALIKADIQNTQWIEEFIAQNYSDMEIMKFLFSIVRMCGESVILKAVEAFSKHCKEFDTFSALPVVPLYTSWTGSEVPMIEEQIRCLEKMKEILVGFEFIEHRAWILDQIYRFEQRKEQELISDFTQNQKQ